MTKSEASISSDQAGEARQELENDNQDAIAAAKAAATRTSTPLNLKMRAESAKLQAACTDFAAVGLLAYE